MPERTDTERIDWLLNPSRCFVWRKRKYQTFLFQKMAEPMVAWGFPMEKNFIAITPRQAIDAAMDREDEG